MWAQMKGPNDPPKALSKKRKKRGIEYQSYGVLAIHEKVKRNYLVRSSMHTIDDEALTAELRSAHQAYALEQAELAKTMVIPSPQFVELPLCTRYPGEGEPLPHGDPPIPMTGHLPRPLGRSVPQMANWVDVCPLDDIHFLELHELAKRTPPAECTLEMILPSDASKHSDASTIPNRFGLGSVPAPPGTLCPCSRAGSTTLGASLSQFTANRMERSTHPT
jgi:hypothetical protein